MWSIATCSPNLELSGKSDSGSGTRWYRILFEKSLARLQPSHRECFWKWLIRCAIDTASALARTTASESNGRGSSGAISLTSAAIDERSPKSPGSTGGSTDESGATGSSRSSGGVSTRGWPLEIAVLLWLNCGCFQNNPFYVTNSGWLQTKGSNEEWCQPLWPKRLWTWDFTDSVSVAKTLFWWTWSLNWTFWRAICSANIRCW